METGTIVSLGLYFALMLGIGLYSYLKTANDVSGYMLGGRQLGPAVTALSAGASDMSGWMLMGLPGAMYVTGLASGWIAIGLTLGALLNYLLVAPRLRVYTEVARDAITIPDYFEKRFEDGSRILRLVSAIVIIVFFTVYTASGVTAGGKLFESAFNFDYGVGLWVTAGVVVAYTLFGGFMAVSITDFVQGCIMFVALIMVPLVAFTQLGGTAGLNSELNSIDPALLDWFGGGIGLVAIFSALSWGLGYFGQPHIIVRFMAIRSLKDVPMARNIGMSWMIVTIIGACATGLIGLAYASENGMNIEDPETIFIVLSQILFSPLIAGFLLAAILAAIMSTISSQLLVASSSLTEDIYALLLRRNASDLELVLVGRAAVLLVALVAILLAYDRSSNVLTLVSNAWAGFGAAFGPLVLISLWWKRMTRQGALAGMIVGAVTVLIWIYGGLTIGGEPLSNVMYEIVPGFILSSIATIVVSLMTGEPRPEVRETFAEVERRLQE
ncbi:sodium/proline symporter PutP [Pacificimonas flava]|uniref:Sodium/proline symporter n=1 Tax=Pacificimonas flava TaxID=1234595 RepID=M2SF97_9SPHN|nr:sodium/proline symporter PutP [Pacificimonas flava]EMD84040.1 Proline/sodium symporter PutP [Pacificimonas flava]MBB5280988.1 SSS family solute:Na+ symporter/sodium/proline symporter [Pacificimonas flava]